MSDRLFLCNCTTQNKKFKYRFTKVVLQDGEDPRFKEIEIPSGTQREIAIIFTSAQMTQFVSALHQNGFKEVNAGLKKSDKSFGLYYRFNKQISEDEIREGHKKDVEERKETTKKGLELMALEATLVAADAGIEDAEIVYEIDEPSSAEIDRGNPNAKPKQTTVVTASSRGHVETKVKKRK